MMGKVRTFAFYLPQYHPVPENDRWWGKGFTEWTNVTKSEARFKGHRQPQLPSDLGFYDLRVAEVFDQQADMARAFGIDGFVFYHYWFEGKRLLEQPYERLLKQGSPFPVALCWANESWTRAWDGRERDMLMAQTYSEKDNLRHAAYLLESFQKEWYLKIDGRPLFFIYRAGNIPCLSHFISTIREYSQSAGVADPIICSVRSTFDSTPPSATFDSSNFDACVDFQPNSVDFPSAENLGGVLAQIAKRTMPDSLYQAMKLRSSNIKRISYRKFVRNIQRGIDQKKNLPIIPSCFPSWDNSARRASSIVIQNDTPRDFGEWYDACLRIAEKNPSHSRFVMVNAWNEWAEGCHLEPDTEMGFAFLDELKARASESG